MFATLRPSVSVLVTILLFGCDDGHVGLDAALDAYEPDIISDIPVDGGVTDAPQDGAVVDCEPLPRTGTVTVADGYHLIEGLYRFRDSGPIDPCGDAEPLRTTLPFDFPFFGDILAAGTSMTADRGVVVFGDGEVTIPTENQALPAGLGSGAIAAMWDDSAPPLETCLRAAGPEVLEIEWLGFPDSPIETVLLRLTPDGVVEVSVHMDGVHVAPFLATIGLEAPDHATVVDSCSPSCDFFPGMTTRFVPNEAPLGPLLFPTCIEAPQTGRYRDEPPRFVHYINIGDQTNPPLDFLHSFDADDESLGGDPNDDIVRPADGGGDFGHAVGAIGPGDSGVGYWVGDGSREYGGFRHEGAVHLVMGGYPDLVYTGQVQVDAYREEALSVEAVDISRTVGAAIDITLSATPEADRWSASLENPSWISLGSDGRLRGVPTSSGTYRAYGFAHRRGHPPGEVVVRVEVTDE